MTRPCSRRRMTVTTAGCKGIDNYQLFYVRVFHGDIAAHIVFIYKKYKKTETNLKIYNRKGDILHKK